jgi:hypothetical protein
MSSEPYKYLLDDLNVTSLPISIGYHERQWSAMVKTEFLHIEVAEFKFWFF